MSKNFLNSKWKWDENSFLEDVLKMVINRKSIDNNIVPNNYYSSDDEVFIEEEYRATVNKVFKNFNLNEKELGSEEKFIKEVLPARIIFYTQYFCGCRSLEVARMIGYSNITNFISAHLSKEICGHKFGMGLIERLQYLFRFYVYDKKVYLNCISKVALASLRDHKNDIGEDIINNHKDNNPFLTGEINDEMYNEFEKELVDIIESKS